MTDTATESPATGGNSPLLTTTEAGKLINVTPAHLRLFASQGHVPHYKSGNNYLFHRQEIIDWAKTGRKRQEPMDVKLPDLTTLLKSGEVELVITARRR